MPYARYQEKGQLLNITQTKRVALNVKKGDNAQLNRKRGRGDKRVSWVRNQKPCAQKSNFRRDVEFSLRKKESKKVK